VTRRSAARTALWLLAACLALVPRAIAAQPAGASYQWQGGSTVRFDSPKGTVILVDPGADQGDEIQAADLVLFTGSVPAPDLRGATHPRILTPGGTASATSGQTSITAAGARTGFNGITIRTVGAVPPPAAAHAGETVGYIVTFEDGATVYLAGATMALDDQASWARAYQPTLAILAMDAQRDPADVALQAQLLQTGNPSLRTIVAGGDPDANTVAAVQQQPLFPAGLRVVMSRDRQPVNQPPA
jgi:hypothetical protein